MSKQIQIELPVLVKQGTVNDRPIFEVMPLFYMQPRLKGRHYELLMGKFKKLLRDYLQRETFGRHNAENFLWWMFNPVLSYQVEPFSFSVGRRRFEGLFGYVIFEWKDLHVYYLPEAGVQMFLRKHEGSVSREVHHQEVQAFLAKWMKDRLQEQSAEEFDFESLLSSKKNVVTTVQFILPVQMADWPFVQDDDNFMKALLGTDDTFDGASELPKVAEHLNVLFPSDLSRAYLRDREVRDLQHLLFGTFSSAQAIVGPKGIGRHTLLHEVLYQYLDKRRSKNKGELYDQQVWLLDPTRLIAGMSYVGWWQRRLEAILQYLHTRHQDLEKTAGLSDILVVDNVVALHRLGKSASNNLTVSQVMYNYLQEGKLRMLVLATPEEWRLMQEKDRRFTDIFQLMRLSEPHPEQALRMVLHQRRHLEEAHHCSIAIQAIDQLFYIQRNFLKNKALPGSVMQILDGLASKKAGREIQAEHVRQAFIQSSGIRAELFSNFNTLEENEVEQDLAQGLIGQEDAVKALADVVHLVQAKLNDPDRPIASLLFIGPTGVGKTQAAKELCKYLLSDIKKLIRIDMSEFRDGDAVDRLIGHYHNPEGILTGKVRYQPYGVLLLDELEKAHPSVHDLLLQVLDDGRLTDRLGRTVDFRNLVIIMTSNLGAQQIENTLSLGNEDLQDDHIYRKAIENYFRPEFVNRIDRQVVFNPLTPKHIQYITRIQIHELLKRDGLVRRSTILNIEEEALKWVADRGYDRQMGGRALKRQIEKDLTVLTAEQLIDQVIDNPIILNIRLRDDKLVPEVIPLVFAQARTDQWLPEIPTERNGRASYRRLHHMLDGLSRRMQRVQSNIQEGSPSLVQVGEDGGANLDWQYYQFKEQVTDMREQLAEMQLGFKNDLYKVRIGQAFSFRKIALINREDYRDKMFQQEGLRELKELYEYSDNTFDQFATEYVDFYISTQFLLKMSEGFMHQRLDRLRLTFKPLVEGQNDRPIHQLIGYYQDLFDTLNIHIRAGGKEDPFIEIEGYNAYALLKGEQGIHLVYGGGSIPIPLYLSVRLSGKQPDAPQYEVIRVYQNRTFSDLRSGFSGSLPMRAAEFKLLLYASWG